MARRIPVARLAETDTDPVPAGELGTWLRAMRTALAEGTSTDVACGSCTGCCESGQFVHIAPDEADALAHIPEALLFPAPRLPTGHVLMGYDERGRCPMLGDSGCTIYEHRPRTCRTYDCRVFPAAGLEPEADKPAIAARAMRWRFDHAGDDERVAHEAVAAAAAFLRAHAGELPEGTVPVTATHVAVLAVELHEHFLRRGATGRLQLAEPEVATIAAVLASRRGR